MITLLRHAPLPLQYQKKYIGHSNIDIDLSLVDKEKIKKLSKTQYDLYYSSDLIRCENTLKLITNQTFTTTKNLREVKFKDFIEGKSFDDISKLTEYDSKFLDTEDSWHTFVCHESKIKFQKRLIDCITALPKDKNILICTHAGVIKELAFVLSKKQITKIDYLNTYELKF